MAESATQKATAAYLQGQQRVEALQWQKARDAVASTGQPALAAKVELMRCAAQVASLEWNDCPAYEALAQDAAQEQAYARYLQGRSQPADIELLPSTARRGAAAEQYLQVLRRSRSRIHCPAWLRQACSCVVAGHRQHCCSRRWIRHRHKVGGGH